MTVQVNRSISDLQLADGDNRTWDFGFKIELAEHAVLVVYDSDGVPTEYEGADITVSGLNVDAGGTVTFPTDASGDAPLPAGYSVVVVRRLPFDQSTRIGNQGRFFPEIHEKAFDRLTEMVQQLRDFGTYISLRLPPGDPAPGPQDTFLPLAADRASNVFEFDADGKPIAFRSIGDIEAAAQTAEENAAATEGYMNAALTARNEAVAAQGQADDDAAATAADRVQTGLDRVATAADAVSTAADRVATGADRAATEAARDAAADSETAAAGSATAANASATDAATDAANTLTRWTDFDKRYLGAKADYPTMDNQGGALVIGALFFLTNPAAPGMRYWDGTDWVAAYISAEGFATKAYVDTQDEALTTAFQDADTALSAAITAAYEAADDAVTTAFGNADTALHTTITAEIAAAIAAISRTGEVVIDVAGVTPANALLMDGSLVSRTTYAALWAYVSAQAVSEATWTGGTSGKFSVGDGATTFRLPDYRGVFMRGTDGGRGLDTGRSQGVYQADAFASHTHGYNDRYQENIGSSAFPGCGNFNPNPQDHAATTNATGSTETRPKNTAVRFFVRYK